ncbi:MAG TPA: carboxypeptidase-like regulatory domain-containing protein [Luteitalea sp.]|nr:carboxypeptidase-like regulatory domain-containing protein [Luteitalea sp.]
MERVLAVVVTLACLCASASSHAQPRVPQAPARDTSASREVAAGRASVFGRVTSAVTGQVVRDAIVTIYQRGGGAGAGPVSARVDAEGQFTFRDVLPGEYTLRAQKPGYVPQSLGQASTLTPGRELLLGPGDVAGPLAIALMPGGVITGRVTDEHGDPVERAQVRAAKLRRFANEWRLLPIGDTVFTDDRGAYRVHSLPPGRYVVSARPLKRPSLTHPQVPIEESPELLPTYAPNVASPAAATQITVDAGRDSEADIVLGTGRLTRVEGRVIDAQGAAVLDGSVALVPRGRVLDSTPFLSRPMHADGSFAFDDVPPGSYTVTARHHHPGGPADGPAFLRRYDVGWVDIDVEGVEVAGVTLRTSGGATLRGRVVVDGANASLAGREVRVSASPDASLPINGFSQALVAADGSFTLDGVHSDVVLRVTGVPFGWWTRSVTLNGRDVTDGLRITSTQPIDGLQLVISTQPLTIRGMVTRPPGSADNAVVVVFRTDATLWEESPRAAGLAASRPLEDGAFEVTGVRPGRYHVIAMRAPQIGDDLSDAEFLRALAARAQTVDVVEGESPTVALVVSDR